MSTKDTTILMTEGNILKKLLVVAIPLILGNLLQQAYNVADSVIVGNYLSSEALAAVGASSFIIMLYIAFCQGAAVGTGVIIAQYLGAKDDENVHIAVHTAISLALLLGIILSIGGILFSRPLLVWMNTPNEILNLADNYLKIFSGGLIFTVLYNMAAGILTAAGNTKTPLYCLAAAAIIHIVLDIIFIITFHLGIEGAAFSTILSELISAVLTLNYLMRVKAAYKLNITKLKIEKIMAFLIIRTGLPVAIQNAVISFSNILVQSGVNSFGTTVVAGFGAYMKIDGFNVLPVMSFSLAVTTFTGQNYGAKNYKRLKKGMWLTLLISVVYTIITGILLLAFADNVMRFFTNDQNVIEYGKDAMFYFCPFYWLLAVLHTLAGTVRGVGKSVPPMIILLISLCLFRIIWIPLILPHFSDISGVYILYPLTWLIGTTMMVVYTWKVKWLKEQ